MVSAAATSQTDIVGREQDRLFLVVVDDSEELANTIRYTCNRACHTGGKMALLYVIDMEQDREFQHWQFVGKLMDQEAQEAAEQSLNRHSEAVRQATGFDPILFIRKGNAREELFTLVSDHPEISILILGSAPGEKPGPLVEAVTGKYAGQLGIPVTVVPGSLSPQEIDRLT